MNVNLSGRRALVTGGSRGLGRATVLAFARAGADVVIVSRKQESCDALADEVASTTGRRAIPIGCHVGHWDALQPLVERVYRRGRASTCSSTTPACRRGTTSSPTSPRTCGVRCWTSTSVARSVFRHSLASAWRPVTAGRSSTCRVSPPNIRCRDRALRRRQGRTGRDDDRHGARVRPQGACQCDPAWHVPH